MTAKINYGPTVKTGDRDEAGHREYKLTYLVECDDPNDGPVVAATAPGLPQPGASWFIGNDVDLWAWCRLDESIRSAEPNQQDPVLHWWITFTFSTKPPPWTGCKGQQIDDPLMQPQTVSGGSVRYTELAVLDKDGNEITNSVLEYITGPNNEWDRNRGQVRISQNVPRLNLDLCEGMRDTVNGSPIWGMPARSVKLSDFTWERKYYGTCSIYFTRNFVFDLRKDFAAGDGLGFDRNLLDEGTKALLGDWDTDKTSPTYGQYVLYDGVDPVDPDEGDFCQYQDRKGNFPSTVLLDHGYPIGWDGNPGVGQTFLVQYYGESDFTQLSIPTNIEAY